MTYLPEYLRHDMERKKSDGDHCVERDEKHGAVGAFHRRLNVAGAQHAACGNG